MTFRPSNFVISDTFDTSLTATALRFLDFTKEPVAVVDVRGKLGQRSKAANFFIFSGRALPQRWERVPASDWFKEGKYSQDAYISERSVGMPKYNSILTLLWIDDVLYDDDILW